MSSAETVLEQPKTLEGNGAWAGPGTSFQRLGSATQRQRDEFLFYDSAKAKRTVCGRLLYTIKCPQWFKVTSKRVVHSAWDCYKPCGEGGLFCLPRGRALETFDADIIQDLSAHQTCLQVLLGEG